MSDTGTASPLNTAPASDIAPTGPASVATPAQVGDVIPPADAPAKPAEPAKVEPAKVDPDKSPLSQDANPADAPAEPIKYDFKVPEGLTLDEAKLTAFNELGNKLKLSPESAQELFDFHAGEMKSTVEAISKSLTEANTKAYTDLIGGWKTELAADPELSGANADTAHEILGKVLDTYGSKEAREAFDLTGAGWNPAVVKMMLKMSKALVEGGGTPQGKPTGMREVQKTPGSVFYPLKQ